MKRTTLKNTVKARGESQSAAPSKTNRSIYLRRYTGLATCIDLLNSKQLTLRSAERWTDQNDRRMMQKYEELAKSGPVVALCFTMSGERHHHWTSYGLGSDAVCIEFKRDALETIAKKMNNVSHDEIGYKFIREIPNALNGDFKKLPFIKRKGFSDENEWRIIAHCDNGNDAIVINFDVGAINKIVVGPHLPQDTFASIKKKLRLIDGCGAIDVLRSRLNDSPRWAKAIDAALAK